MERLQNNRRIYVDLEYCYPGMTKERGRPNDQDLRQIVQIAAIRFDTETGKELDAFNVLVRPTYETILPLFFVELTSITQKELDQKGIPLAEAIRRFTFFCGEDAIWTFNADWDVLKQNCGYINLSFPFEQHPFVRVKPLLSSWGIDPEAYSSGTLFRAAGLDMDGHVHNALHDVRSMAAAVHVFENR